MRPRYRGMIGKRPRKPSASEVLPMSQSPIETSDCRRQSVQEYTMEGLEGLIPVINKLQDVFATINSKNIELPQIVVVGTQSAGKSSVLESMVKRDFLPRGGGIVTRRPLVLQLINTPLNDTVHRSKQNGTLDGKIAEWGQFLHKKDEIFSDFDKIRQEIENDTDREAGANKGIVEKPINLKVFSPIVPNVTLVDLPGITKVPVGQQPPDIEKQIKRMIMTYITNPQSIILAVTAANVDMATSEAIQMAQQVDPEGFRTLAVLTKLDLMDKGTDARDALEGKVIPVKLGIIGVKNRSQLDINNKKSVDDCLTDEVDFFHKVYPSLAATNGTVFLGKRLNELLLSHIRQSLPDLKRRVQTMIQEREGLLQALGEPVQKKDMTMHQLIKRFNAAYCELIDGLAVEAISKASLLNENSLTGGSLINRDIFYGSFKTDLGEIVALDGVTLPKTLLILRCTTGLQPHVVVSDKAFLHLVKEQVEKLRGPSERCVERVHEELQRIVELCGTEIERDFQRFPKFHYKLVSVVNNLLREKMEEAKKLVKKLVKIHMGFINTRHAEFRVEAAAMWEAAQQQKMDEKQQFLDNFLTFDRQHSNQAPRKKSVLEDRDAKLKARRQREQQAILDKAGVFRGNAVAEPQMEEREKEDCELVLGWTAKYFDIVRNTVEDTVPKAIFEELINPVKDELHMELIQALITAPGVLDGLLEESKQSEEHRKVEIEMLIALRKAADIISEVRDFNF